MKTFIKLFLVAALLLSQGICAAQPLPAADTLTALTDSLAATKVTARKNKVIYRIDKTVISGAANATAEGRTAADIISTLPSVRTDAQGDITFRGSSGFLVYVNGKPSMLEGTAALRQIQASNVEDIEIITTPSANFQSDGEAGIINIITKKGEGEGLTGSINLAGSTLASYNADILIGYRRGHNHFYGGVESSSDKRKSEFYQEKNTDVLGVETTSVSDGFRFGNNRVNIGRLGWEFEKGRHRLTLELQGGQTENRRGGDMTYDETRDFAGNPQMSATFNSADRYILRKNMVQLSPTYRFEINDKGDYLSFIGRFRYDIYSLEYTESNLHYQNGSRYEGTRGFEEEHHDDYDFTISYCKNLPVGKFETGYQMTYYTEIGGYRIRYWEPEAQDFEWQEDLAAPFYYRRQVHSLYAMCSGNEGSLSWDAGLRGDCVIDDVDVEVPDGELHQKIPNLFPSGHLRWAINPKSTITAGYSYRVNRPGIWQTEPYITYEDYYTKKKGNMHIRPNYIQSAEASFRRNFGKGSHILANLFLRSSKDKLEWIRVAYEPGVTLDTIVNTGNELVFGAEFSGAVHISKWWELSAGASGWKCNFTAVSPECSDSDLFSYQANIGNTFKAGKTNIQFDSYFVGPTILSQGREEAYYYSNLGVYRMFFKEKLRIGISASDIFHTARYENFRQAQGLVSRTYVRPVYPNIMLSLGWTFNTDLKQKSVSTSNIFEGKDF